jgi:hypothetical protein
MTEPVTLTEPVPAAEPAATATAPVDRDDPGPGTPAEALEHGPVYDVDSPGGCG